MACGRARGAAAIPVPSIRLSFNKFRVTPRLIKRIARKRRPLYYVIPTLSHVIPSVAEESEMPALTPFQDF